ncbi:MAG: hypothetical protein V2A79_05055, partial [Planctomycetota bacterium]
MGSRRPKTGKRGATHAQPTGPVEIPKAPRPPIQTAPTWLRVALPMVVAIAAFVTFLPTLEADFVSWDDDKLFLNNKDYRGLGWPNLKWMFTETKMGHWQPLSWVTLGLDYTLYGMWPRGYHRTNMLLHAGCAVAFYFLAMRLLAYGNDTAPLRSRFGAQGDAAPAPSRRGPSHSQSAIGNPQSAIDTAPSRSRFGSGVQPFGVALRIAAAAAALFFALHPLRVESVAWVTERRDLLSGLFFILSITAYLKSRTAERRRLLWYLGAVAVFILSVLSKAWGMTIPAVLIVLDFYPLRRLGGRVREWLSPAALWVWFEKLPFAVIAALTAVKAVRAQA